MIKLICTKNQILEATGNKHFTKDKIYDFNETNNTIRDDADYIWLHYNMSNVINEGFVTLSQYRKLKLNKINEAR